MCVHCWLSNRKREIHYATKKSELPDGLAVDYLGSQPVQWQTDKAISHAKSLDQQLRTRLAELTLIEAGEAGE